MEKVITKLVLIIILTIVSLLIQRPVQAMSELPFEIETKGEIIREKELGMIYLYDRAKITRDNDLLEADEIIINLEEEKFIATGNIILSDGEYQLQGQHLEYNYGNGQGRLIEGRIQAEGFRFSGREILLSEKEYLTLLNAQLTPCRWERPHYALQVERIEFYPKEKIAISGVWLSSLNKRVFPLPGYTIDLTKLESKEQTESDEERIEIISTRLLPSPGFGYNKGDGTYASLSSDHYVNEALAGRYFFKYGQLSKASYDVGYRYYPNEYLDLELGVGYLQELGWRRRLFLENKLQWLENKLVYDYYFASDRASDYYRQRMMEAHWQLKIKPLDLSLSAQFDDNPDIDDTRQLYKFNKSYQAYYLQLKHSLNYDFDYQPELKLGMADKELGSNLFSASYAIGKLSFAAEESLREKFNLAFRNPVYEINESLALNWVFEFSDASYDREDNYRSYGVELGSKLQAYGDSQLELDYQFFDEYGTTPVKADALTEELIGRRHYLETKFRDGFKVRDYLEFEAQLQAGSGFYTASDYDTSHSFAGLKISNAYQIGEQKSLTLSYDYLTTNGNFLLERDEKEEKNILGLGYSLRRTGEYSFWQLKTQADYDLRKSELSKLNYSLQRGVDCLQWEIEIEQLERSFDFMLKHKIR